ncbi:MAG: ATP-dependent DNA helicase [Cyanothece sp. SIO1E1]|nr:ATP-dependent DNA helicase [Cyanothece sp. SIO1E1]
MIEVEVHQQLRAFLREQGEPYWPHHLTMARLVARALRLGRSALMQAGAPSGYHGRYRLSYLMPALIWPGSTILVAPEALQKRLLIVEIPRLQQWISIQKPIQVGDRWPDNDFTGLLLTSPQAWLSDQLAAPKLFPTGIPTILDGVDDLEAWTREQLTAQIHPQDWDALMLTCPEHRQLIRDSRVQLTRALFDHPANPYECHLIEAPERAILSQLHQAICASAESQLISMPAVWQQFWQRFQAQGQLLWSSILRRQGQFVLCCGPVDLSANLTTIWPRQPVVLIGGALELTPEAPIYRQKLGLGEITCLKFSPDRQHECVQLYLPEHLPMPNTPEFQSALMQEIRTLLCMSASGPGLIVLLVNDMPLKAQVGSVLASEFGSRVQVEKTCLDENAILVTGWEFWRQYQGVLSSPQLLVIATLPIPSLENPLVAGRVAYYKQARQDWFRLYLLPEALSELQRAIAPARDRQGIVALLDNRVNYRSYGHQVLSALSPFARISYIDSSWFDQPDYSVMD